MINRVALIDAFVVGMSGFSLDDDPIDEVALTVLAYEGDRRRDQWGALSCALDYVVDGAITWPEDADELRCLGRALLVLGWLDVPGAKPDDEGATGGSEWGIG